MTGIKLCGMRRMCDIEVVNEIRPEYAGFVFVPGKRRFIPPFEAAELVRNLCQDTASVGVFLNASPEYICESCRRSGVGYAQVHGDFDNRYIRTIRHMVGIPVIQALTVSSEKDIERANQSEADLVLLDNGLGGTGMTFDWNLLAGMEREYILAGGLDAGNIENALTTCNPYAVDVSSGIETDGLKDPVKMKAFADAVRRH